ncbi:MAG: gluconokinase [Actinomycetota bacterium]|nr:gluconokinase [Actinomycetota bacterium]
MGVSGSGKTTVAQAMAEALQVAFIEGDDLHPAANRAKMRSGTPLDDEDRWPWLDEVARRLGAPGDGAVASCSALRRSYRDRIRRTVPDAWFLHLHGDPALLERRQATRKGHFMPPSLMQSQLDTLEPLQPDEPGLLLDVAAEPESLMEQALAVLTRR